MNAYEFAMKMEEDGRNYYLEQAECTHDVQLKKLFKMLAEDENRHYEIIKSFVTDPYYKTSDTFKNVKTVFSDKIKANACFEVETSRLESYEHAIRFEDESIEFYEKKALETKDTAEKNILLRLAKEEKGHKVILENLLEFIRKPTEWVESAEFTRIEDYNNFTEREEY